jgi:hypothetical protein
VTILRTVRGGGSRVIGGDDGASVVRVIHVPQTLLRFVELGPG